MADNVLSQKEIDQLLAMLSAGEPVAEKQNVSIENKFICKYCFAFLTLIKPDVMDIVNVFPLSDKKRCKHAYVSVPKFIEALKEYEKKYPKRGAGRLINLINEIV